MVEGRTPRILNSELLAKAILCFASQLAQISHGPWLFKTGYCSIRQDFKLTSILVKSDFSLRPLRLCARYSSAVRV